MQPLVHWAAYLPPEQGQPKPDETPVLFVAVCQDEACPAAMILIPDLPLPT